jgi:Flp pilus assembly protein TadD
MSTPLGLAGVAGAEALQGEIDLFVKAGRWIEADKALEKWVLLEPRNAEAYNNLGLAKKKLGSKEAAYEQYQKALALRPDYPEALNNLGVLFLSEGKLSEGKGYFQKAIQFKPDFAEPYFHLALIAESEGKDLEARAQFQKYLQLARDLDASFLLQIQNRIDALKSSG